MILAVEIGNTNITIGCIEDGVTRFKARVATDVLKTSDQYSVELKNLLDLFECDAEAVEGSILASVVPPVLNSFRSALQKVTGQTPLVVGPGIKTGLNIRMDQPAQVGSSLIVAAAAALQEHQPPMIVFDMGTATTITVLGRENTYLGGCIYPGVQLSLDALTTHTSQLPGINLEKPRNIIGKNTVDCMRSGIMYGTAAMMDGMIDRIEEQLGEPASLLATGSIARFVVPMCRHSITIDPELNLKGLWLLYRLNQGGAG